MWIIKGIKNKPGFGECSGETRLSCIVESDFNAAGSLVCVLYTDSGLSGTKALCDLTSCTLEFEAREAERS